MIHPPSKSWAAPSPAIALVLLVLACALPAAAQAAGAYPAAASRPAIRASRAALARADARARRAAAGAHSPASKRRPAPLEGDPEHALLAFQAMQRYYYILGSGLYKGEPFSYLWPFSQALAATVTLANVPALSATIKRELKPRLVGLTNYLDTDNSGSPEGTFTSNQTAFDGTVAPPSGPGGTKYYDDNDWIGIELVRVYRLTHEVPVLATAEEIMSFEINAWQTNPELGCVGGIPFSNALTNTERNTITTAPAAELALQLYSVTGLPTYLQFAEQAYEWVRKCLLEPSGLYGDHVNKQGVIEPRLWSYTQGAMIGAGTMLYQTTGNTTYLAQAEQTVQASLAYFTGSRLGGEIPFFPSVYFRNLLYFDAVTRQSQARPLAQSFVDYYWGHLRLSNDLFVTGSPPTGQLLVQAALVQIYGLLSSSPSTYF
jgi:hypothetical protein